MNKPFPAYQGTESFVFVCYAHRDSDVVYADLIALHNNAVNVWYDEGIAAGSSWRAEIARAIKGATKFIFFISEASLKSTHCLREIDYALNNDIKIIPVYLDDSSLPAELELVLNRVQALFRSKDTGYIEHLLGALKDGPRIAPLRLIKKNRTMGLVLPGLALGISVLLLFFWMQRDVPLSSDQSRSIATATPNAFDRYLEGLELVERWDLNDNLDTAIGLFREATSLDPGFALAYARLAEALRIRYGLTGDPAWLDEATSKADQALLMSPDLAPVQVAIGRIHTTRGNIDLAYAALQRALAIDANDGVANLAMAVVYERLGRLEDAEASFQKAISLQPENLSVLDNYANFLFRQSRYDEAVHQWQAIVRIAPDHFAALTNLGSALSETDRIAEAITVYLRAIEVRPTYMAYTNLGTAYSQVERYPESVDAYQKALAIEDTDWLAWGNLAYVYTRMNGMEALAAETFARAVQLAEVARQQNPRDPFVNSDLALYYAKTGQPELALQRLSTALALSPDSGAILTAAAEAYELIGQRDQAIELARKSLELGYSRQRMQRNPDFSALFADPRMQTF